MSIRPHDLDLQTDDIRYYSGYLQFFQNQVLQNGMGNVLETYVFSPEANEGEAAKLPRLFSGLLHPLIHLGHGPEFALPGLAAEGKQATKVMPRIIYIWFSKDSLWQR
jgi:hypothetical protein